MPREEAIDPLAQLERCHRKLEEACTKLGPALESQDKAVVEEVAAFFDRQIRQHEIDEDGSLFPRLANKTELTGILQELEADHIRHVELRRRFQAAVAALDWAALRTAAAELVDGYRAHVALEESDVFPVARASLTPEDLASMRVEMDARRGGPK